jgi:hypothetical protein
MARIYNGFYSVFVCPILLIVFPVHTHSCAVLSWYVFYVCRSILFCCILSCSILPCWYSAYVAVLCYVLSIRVVYNSVLSCAVQSSRMVFRPGLFHHAIFIMPYLSCHVPFVMFCPILSLTFTVIMNKNIPVSVMKGYKEVNIWENWEQSFHRCDLIQLIYTLPGNPPLRSIVPAIKAKYS